MSAASRLTIPTFTSGSKSSRRSWRHPFGKARKAGWPLATAKICSQQVSFIYWPPKKLRGQPNPTRKKLTQQNHYFLFVPLGLINTDSLKALSLEQVEKRKEMRCGALSATNPGSTGIWHALDHKSGKDKVFAD